MPGLPARIRGFTLVEVVIAMVITGILAGIVAVFIKSPIDSYVDLARRAELTDIADTAVRRIARDVRLSLPNSVRNPVDNSDGCVEFIPTKIGGRYRSSVAVPDADLTRPSNVLDFTAEDDIFDMLWLNSALPLASRIVAGDVAVVYNDGFSGSAYGGTNAIRIASIAEPQALPVAGDPPDNTSRVTFVTTAATERPFELKRLPAESPSRRFQIIPSDEHVVAYECWNVGTTGGNGTGELRRHARTLSAAWAQPAGCTAMAATPAAPATFFTSVLARNLSRCSLHYEVPGSGTGLSRNSLLSISLEVTQASESVRLYHQVHVANTP